MFFLLLELRCYDISIIELLRRLTTQQWLYLFKSLFIKYYFINDEF